MTSDSNDMALLLKRAAAGERAAFEELVTPHRDRLARMVHLRLHRRLLGRVRESDVLQEAFANIFHHLGEYTENSSLPLFLWLRTMTCTTLGEIHRRHLGAQGDDAQSEVSLHRGGLPVANSMSLAAQMLGKLMSRSPEETKAETRLYVQQALSAMAAVDRELLALRHFEQLSTLEAAQVLGMSKGDAGSRYLKALKRLREILSQIPGFEKL